MKTSRLVELSIPNNPQLGKIVSDIRRMERIVDAAEKMLRNIDANITHPVDMMRLRQEIEYPKRGE